MTMTTKQLLGQIVSSPDAMDARLVTELEMDLDGLRCVVDAIKRPQDAALSVDDRAGYIRQILEPMTDRFAAYIQVARLLDEGIR